MGFLKLVLLSPLALVLANCGTLDSKTILLGPGDDKQSVIEVMGIPEDRQFRFNAEAWQYCITGAGYGYNDHKIIWFEYGQVTGITSYKTYRTGCVGQIRPVNWTTKPDVTIETHAR